MIIAVWNTENISLNTSVSHLCARLIASRWNQNKNRGTSGCLRGCSFPNPLSIPKQDLRTKSQAKTRLMCWTFMSASVCNQNPWGASGPSLFPKQLHLLAIETSSQEWTRYLFLNLFYRTWIQSNCTESAERSGKQREIRTVEGLL